MMKRLLFAITMMFYLGQVTAQVTADFNIQQPASNCNPAVYSFNNLSTGVAPLSYEWNFGVYSGVNSVFRHPGTTYLNCGTFSVKLVVTNGNGQKDSVTKTVVVHCSPRPDFTVSEPNGCLPHSTKFISTSQPGSGTIANLLWDFGDGTSGSGTSEEHSYTTSGCKNVTLIATNSFGCIKDTTKPGVFCAFPKPSAAFTSPVTTSCNLPLHINYNNTTSGGTPPYSYKWSFEGGSPNASSQSSPQVNYNSLGSFTTTLVVTDAGGCTDTLSKANYINTVSSNVNFTMSSTTGCAPGNITVSASTVSPPLSYRWEITPSATISGATARNATISFSDSGTYQICLQVNYGNNCIANRCSTVVVNPAPVAKFSADGLMNTCIQPNPITYTDSSSGGQLAYNWSFPGGVPSSSTAATPPTVVYNNCGTYSTHLTVNNNYGCTATYSLPTFMTITCPENSFVVGPRYGCIPLTAEFSSFLSTGSAVGWLWNFGDTASGTDNISTLKNPSHTFHESGCYEVTLTTITAEGCSVTTKMNDAICCGHRPHPNFSANPPVNCVNQPIYFTDSSTNTFEYTTYIWDFYGGPPYDPMSREKNPVFAYGDTGVFDITLIVSNYGCADTITKDDYVKILAPAALPRVITDCKNPLQVILDGSGSTAAQRYKWVIPGGSPPVDSSAIVTVTYSSGSVHNATLIVYNDSTGCSDIADIIFSTYAAKAEFTASPQFSCAPANICTNNASLNGSTYSWQIINSVTKAVVATSTAANPCFNITTAGIYDMRLIVNDAGGCSDTMYRSEYIQVNTPAANFTGAPITGCAPLTTNFSDASTVASTSAPIMSWNWNFGDAASGSQNTSTLQHPSHTYYQPGNYTITQTVRDSTGCLNTRVRSLYVLVTDPKARFTSPDTVVCNGSNVCFSNTSTGTGLTYRWDFGNGAISTTANPCYRYPVDSGLFTVTLFVTDGIGCRDTLRRNNFIKIQKFTAALTANITNTDCPPLAVQFTNTSRNTTPGTTYKWDFGDQQISSLNHPFHIYNSPGVFDVTLIALSPQGCKDTLWLKDFIRVGGPAVSITKGPGSGCTPHNTCMKVLSPTAVSYTWNLGDGTVTTGGDTICYTYVRPGTFYPELILADAGGCVFSKPMGEVNVGGAVSYFKNVPAHICGPQTINFIDSSYGVSNIESILWNFGDPSSGSLNTSSIFNPSHFYVTPGNYKITHRITMADGCINSSEKTIKVSPAIALNISLSDSSSCGPDTVHFYDHTIHPAPYMFRLWTFGDPISGNENYSGLPDPSHYFSQPGEYPVVLMVSDTNGCKDTARLRYTVHEQPVADFSALDACLNSQPIAFRNHSQFAGHYHWSFGDGETTNQYQPLHQFKDTGTYFVRLNVNNKYCSDSVTKTVRIHPLPEISFNKNTEFLCGPPATFTPLNTTKNAHTFSWNFGDGGISALENPTHIYQKAGTYMIQLSGQNQYGCRDTVSDNLIIHPYPITNNIDIESAEGCSPLTVTFKADITHGNIYTWNFGDGTDPFTTTLPTVSHTYTDTGKYTVSLHSTSQMNCGNTVVLNDTIKVYVRPVAAFDYSTDTVGYFLDGLVVFTNRSINAVRYEWDFGDGSVSFEENPNHLYHDAREFQVILYAESGFGCRDSVSASAYVVKKSLYVPNAFAPDHTGGDNLVRVWKPIGIGLKTYRASIYNTWGELIWESDKLTIDGRPSESWDGTYRGNACQQDVYVWKIEAIFYDGTVWQGMSYNKGSTPKTMGDISLIR